LEKPTGGPHPLPHDSQFKYQLSKSRADNHNIWNLRAGLLRKIAKQPQGNFRFGSKANDAIAKIREENQSTDFKAP
jgi:hypothetical protein